MEALQGISWGIVAPILVIQLILLIIALIDLSKIHQTNGPKWLWAIIIIAVNIIGPILYFVFGRKQS
ncbi:MAG: PLDc N-terminal domain-containing protein [Paenisporosarcina sp.]